MKKFQVPAKKLPLDWLGSLFIGLATICLVLFITWGGEPGNGYPWSSPIIILLIIFTGFFSVLFVLQEYRHPYPTLQLHLHTIRNVWVNYLIGFFSYYAMSSEITYLAIYFQTVIGDRAVISGLKLGGFIFGFMLTARWSGKILPKTSKSNILMGLSGGLVVIGLGLSGLITPEMNYGYVFLFTSILGFGIGFLVPAAGALVQMAVPQKDIAVAMSNYSFDSYIGGCIGVTISGSIFTRTLTQSVIEGHDYRTAVCEGVAAACLWGVPPAVIAAVLSFFIHPPKQKTPKDQSQKEAVPLTSTTTNNFSISDKEGQEVAPIVSTTSSTNS